MSGLLLLGIMPSSAERRAIPRPMDISFWPRMSPESSRCRARRNARAPSEAGPSPGKLEQSLGERFRILLGDPVACPGHTNAGHILGDLLHHLLHQRTAGADCPPHRQDRHRKLSAAPQVRPIVL